MTAEIFLTDTGKPPFPSAPGDYRQDIRPADRRRHGFTGQEPRFRQRAGMPGALTEHLPGDWDIPAGRR